MATSYTAVFLIPDSETFSGSGTNLVFYQLTSGSNNASGTAQEVIDFIFNDLANTLGGSYTITATDLGANTEYLVVWTGLTSDPSLDPLTGDLAAIAIQADSNTFFSASFLSASDCEDLGLCPECPPSVNPEDAEDCLSCYQQTVESCEDEIIIYGLEDSTTYEVTITDNVSGRKYLHSTISDTYGEITLDTADFPTGLFSPYNSPLLVTITQSGVAVVLTYGYVNYSCIELVVINSETV